MNDLIIPEKWLMGLVNLQVYNTVYNITERNNKLSHYILDIDMNQ